MKYATLMLLAFFSCCASLQAQSVLVKDSTHQVEYGYPTNTINTYTYDSGCKPLLTYTDGADGDIRYLYTYNASGSLYRLVIEQLTNDGKVYSRSRKTYRYLRNGKIEAVYSEQEQRGGTYTNDSLTVYQYNPQNLPARKLVQLWNPNTSQYENNRLDSTLYNSQGQLTKLFTFLWPNGVKKLAYKTLKSYNSYSFIDTSADYDYIDFDTRVIGTTIYTYTYFNSPRTKYERVGTNYVSYVPGGWAFVNTERTLHDSANLVSTDTITNSNTDYQAITYYITHRYNSDNTLQSVSTIEDYYGDGYIDKTVYTGYTYASCSAGMASAKMVQAPVAAGIAAGKTALSVSPNPVASVMHVSLPAAAKANGVVRLFDAGGRMVLQQTVAAGSSSLNIDCSSLGKGMYILNYEGAALKVIKE